MIFKIIYTKIPRPKPSGPQIEKWRSAAKAFLPERTAMLAKRFGFVYHRVFIKNNRSNWGSCSSKGNINLNLQIMRLPSHLQDFIILHELCHTKFLNHGPEFHDLLNNVTGGMERSLQRELREYHTV